MPFQDRGKRLLKREVQRHTASLTRTTRLLLDGSTRDPASRFTMSNPYYQQYQQQQQQQQHQQQQQQQQSHDVNPYHQPYQGPTYPVAGSSSGHTAPVPANAYEYDVGILAQQSVYVPGAMIDKRGGAGGKLAKGGKRTTVLRKGAGTVYEDQTLLEWNPGKGFAEFLHWTSADPPT